MDIVFLEQFFLWCMLINLGVYIFTVLAVFFFRGLVCKMHKMIFGFNEDMAMQAIQKYLANYKLLITIFNFTPWIAILIIK